MRARLNCTIMRKVLHSRHRIAHNSNSTLHSVLSQRLARFEVRRPGTLANFYSFYRQRQRLLLSLFRLVHFCLLRDVFVWTCQVSVWTEGIGKRPHKIFSSNGTNVCSAFRLLCNFGQSAIGRIILREKADKTFTFMFLTAAVRCIFRLKPIIRSFFYHFYALCVPQDDAVCRRTGKYVRSLSCSLALSSFVFRSPLSLSLSFIHENCSVVTRSSIDREKMLSINLSILIVAGASRCKVCWTIFVRQ